MAGGIGKALLDKRRASAQREAIEALEREGSTRPRSPELMATPADLDRIARALPGVSVGKYWDDPAAYLMEGRGLRGGRGLANKRSPRRDEGTVDPAPTSPFTDLVVVHTSTPEAARRRWRVSPGGLHHPALRPLQRGPGPSGLDQRSTTWQPCSNWPGSPSSADGRAARAAMAATNHPIKPQ